MMIAWLTLSQCAGRTAALTRYGFESLSLRFIHCSPAGTIVPEGLGEAVPSSGLTGPYALTGPNILTHVSPGMIGAYVLGKSDKSSNIFLIAYAGRSDTDVATRLQNWVGSYDEFKFVYFHSAQVAFEKECHLYHDFNPPDNKVHPARPSNSNAKCPRCSIFG